MTEASFKPKDEREKSFIKDEYKNTRNPQIDELKTLNRNYSNISNYQKTPDHNFSNNNINDLGDFKYLRSEVDIMKKSLDDNKKVVLIFKDDVNTTIGSINYKFDVLNKDFNLVRDNYMVLLYKYILTFLLEI